MTSAGFIDIVYVTDDFDASSCFQVGQTYVLEYRDPSSPGIKTGISLAKEGIHYGWVKEKSREGVDRVLQGKKTYLCRVKARGKRWQRYDNRLGVNREW
ncbi:hypothetical protein V8C43DRAFT_301025 [Trichoderma afarasin]